MDTLHYSIFQLIGYDQSSGATTEAMGTRIDLNPETGDPSLPTIFS